MSELSGYLEETGQTQPETSPEPTETPAVAETVEPSPVDAYVAKYGGDTQKALEAAIEAQSLIGRQGQELGAIRQELQTFREQFTPEATETDGWENAEQAQTWAQEMAYSDNWREGAQYALDKNDPSLYETIMEGAYQTDPRGATRFEMYQASQYQEKQLLDKIGPTIAPMVAASHSKQFTDQWNDLRNNFEDIDNLSSQMMQIAQSRPDLVAALKNPSAESQRQVITDLYALAKLGTVAPLQQVAGQAAENAAANAAQLHTQAAVGTATASAPVEPLSDETPQMQDYRATLREELGLDPVSGESLT